MLDLDTVNEELQVIADENRLVRIEEEYEMMLDQMMYEHHMMEYASHSYDLDAEYYGEH